MPDPMIEVAGASGSPVADNTRGVYDKIVATYEMLRLAWAKFREEALRNYEYVIGEQITQDVRDELARQNRPALVYNLMQNKIITLAGTLETNKAYMRAVPSGDGDEGLADMHTRLVSDHAIKNCNGVRQIAKATLDAAIGKIGWTNNYWTTRNKPEGEWITESADPFMLMFDAAARKQDQTDWRYYTYSGFYTAEEIIGTYNEHLTEAQKAYIMRRDAQVSGLEKRGKIPVGWFDRVWSGVTDVLGRIAGRGRQSYDDSAKVSDYVDSRTGRYRIIEFHDVRFVTKRFFYNPSLDQSVDCPSQGVTEPDESYRARLEKMGMNLQAYTGGGWVQRSWMAQEKWITVIAPFLLPGEIILEMPYPVQNAGFQHKPIFCYDLHPDITKTQSILDVLVDPQNSYNQRRMSMLEWVMDMVNPDWTVPKGSIDPSDEAAWKSKERGVIKPYLPKSGLKPERDLPPTESGAALKAFADEDREISETLTGITPNSQGMQESAGESGVLFAQKVQRSMVALSYLFGNMHEAMASIFTYCDRNLQQFMTMPRKVRLLNKTNQPEWLMLNMPTLQGVQNDVSQGEYDFKVDPTVLGETAKQIKFQEAMNFVGIVSKLNPQAIKLSALFDLWDSPVAEEMKQYAEQVVAMQTGMVVQQQQQQAAQAALAQMKGMGDAVGSLNNAAAIPQTDVMNQPSVPAPAAGGLQAEVGA